jgi:archaetidylinositol phosphate synthase
VTAGVAAQSDLYRRSIKHRPGTEFVCEAVFRPAAQLVVLALRPLRVAPPAVVLANTACGLAGAVAIARGNLIAGALLLQAKTVLDNADGQLARATGRVSVLGRYLDSESDLLVNAAVLAAVGYAIDGPLLALSAFLVLTLVLSLDFDLERLYRCERGDERDPAPPAETGPARTLARIYAAVYGTQDRLIESFVEWRLRRLGAGPAERLAYHDRATLQILANFGLSTQLAALGICLAVGRPEIYCYAVLGCGVAIVPLLLRRELLARRARTTVNDEEGTRAG